MAGVVLAVDTAHVCRCGNCLCAKTMEILKVLCCHCYFGRGDDTVGNPHRPQIYKLELFELILLLEFDKQFPVERVDATVSQSAVRSPPSY